MGRRLRWMPRLSQSRQVSAPLKFDHSLNASLGACWYQRGPILVNVSALCVVWSCLRWSLWEDLQYSQS